MAARRKATSCCTIIFGINGTTFWYVQWFGDRVRIDMPDMVLESLRMAVRDWETPHKTLPDTAIASGKLAYAYLTDGLERGDYDERGAVYILRAYAHARKEIAAYLRDVGDALPGLKEVAALYDELARTNAAIEDCMEECAGFARVRRSDIGKLCGLLREAERLEEKAVEQFRAISARHPDRKRSIVPRWGVHSPR